MSLTVEVLGVWQQRNDVRIPPDTGTEFSLVDLIGSAATPNPVNPRRSDRAAEDTDIGFVPLGHVSADARLAERWSVGLALDGSAAPQGRAIDFATVLEYRPAPRWTVFGGYRTIEGGADVDAVYTFAWLNAVVTGIGVRF